MEDKKPCGRHAGSKVSQIANIFQNQNTDVIITNPVPLRNNLRDGSPKAERRRTTGGEEMSPAQVTVMRTESHVARFNNARALFEKLAEDKKPDKFVVRTASSNSSPDSSPKRSPSRLSGSQGSLGSLDSVEEVENVQPNGRSNGNDSSFVSMTVTERLAQNRINGSVNGLAKNGVDAFKRPDAVKKPEKPEKPERKFNSRELIEKQRNWTSHFSKSRNATRYNSDPNKSDVTVSLSQEVLPDEAKMPVANPAARSASFTAASRVIRSPACSPPPPPTRDPHVKPKPPVNNATRPDVQSHGCNVGKGDFVHNSTRTEPQNPTFNSSKLDLQSPTFNSSKVELQSPNYNSSKLDLQSPTFNSSKVELQSPTYNSSKLDLQPPYDPQPAGGISPRNDPQPRGPKVPPPVNNATRPDLIKTASPVNVTQFPRSPVSPANSPAHEEKSTDSSSTNSDSILLSPGRHSDVMLDGDKRLREEDSSEVRQDVAHVAKRNKVVVSSVSVRLGAAGLGPTPPSTVRSSSTSFSDEAPILRSPSTYSEEAPIVRSPSTYSDESPIVRSPSTYEAPIVNSVLRDLEASRQQILPAGRYTEVSTLGMGREEGEGFVPKGGLDLIGGSGYVVTNEAVNRTLVARRSVEPPKVPSPEDEVEEVKELSAESVLDLHDVEYADADGEEGSEGSDEAREGEAVPAAMTQQEADNLLSSRQESVLSDEEAQEVVRLLSPSEEPADREDPEWLAEVLSASSNSLLNETLHDSTLDGRSRSEISATLEDSMTSSRIGSQSGSDLLGSVSSLTDQDATDFYPEPGKIVLIEAGVHYYEDGHFWMEVPGIPDPEEDEDAHLPIPVKQNMKVKFSTGPIQVFSTFSVNDYDRRNDDVDPVAASAEYELEKRVEKMDVFPVELIKGPEGLGLSIIGMGVGADAGLEKLGIFVKTITDNGAAAQDERIQVNDQIIEVDAKSLVGVTQAYAASVLRNTCGLVRFLIGRERDVKNSEVAQLIKQSLQADKERDEHRRMMEQQTPPRTTSRGYHHLADPTGNSPERSEDSSTTLPLSGTSPTTSSSSDAPLSPPGTSDNIFEMEPPVATSNDLDSIRRLLVETRMKLNLADCDIVRLKSKLTEMEGVAPDNEEFIERLRQSSLRLRETERNFYAAKKDVASYQEMIEQSQGQYLALEKKYCKAKKLLRDFQQREQDMAHREEFYLQLIQENDIEYNALVKSLKDRVIALEQELLQTQRAAGMPPVLPYDGATLRQLTPQLSRRERPPPVKPLLQDTELSDTDISDVSPEDGDKTATVERKLPVKEELDRAVPQHELLDVSASKAKGELGTRGGLANRQLPTNKKVGGLTPSNSDYSMDGPVEISADEEEQDRRQPPVKSPTRPSTLPTPPSSHVHSLVAQFATAQQAVYAHATHVPTQQALHLHPHQHQPQPYTAGPQRPPPSLAEQLKQVLAERERRISGGEASSREGSGDYTDLNKGISQTLVEEIRQAVNEANARVKRVPITQTLLSPGSQQPWLPQHSPLRDMGPPSPSSMSSGSISPGASLEPRLGDSTTDIWAPPEGNDKKGSHVWQTVPVNDWSKEQVCQWLMALNLEQHIPKFLELQIGGSSLLQLESRDLKQLGVCGEDKNRLKRKLKDLKARVEKEKRQQEKERKYKEQLQKKAEKLAFKASKQK